MKKWNWIVFTALCLMLCACSNVENDPSESTTGSSESQPGCILTTKSDETLLTYTTSQMACVVEPMFTYCVSVTTDGTISVENKCSNYTVPDDMRIYVSETLTPTQYKEIYTYFNGSELLQSDGVYDDYTVCDGGYYFIDFSMDDGSKFRAGGCNPQAECFLEAKKYLLSFITEDMNAVIIEKTQAFVDYYNENSDLFWQSNSQNDVPPDSYVYLEASTEDLCVEAADFLSGIMLSESKGVLFRYGEMTYRELDCEGNMPQVMCLLEPIEGGIITSLNIGSDYADIEKELGVPDSIIDDSNSCIYYREGYCVAFHGKKTIDCIAFLRMPKVRERYNQILSDIAKWNKESPSTNSVFSNDIYDNLYDNYPAYYNFTLNGSWRFDYCHGLTITDSGVTIEKSYYNVDWPTVDSLEITYDETDMWLSEFALFCEKYFSKDWLMSSDQKTRAYFENDSTYQHTKCMIQTMETGRMTSIYTKYFTSDPMWLDNRYLLCNNSLYGPMLIDSEGGYAWGWAEEPIQAEVTYSVAECGDIDFNYMSGKSETYTVEQLLEEYNERILVND